MTQLEYDVIQMVIREGVPVLAEILSESLDHLVDGFNALRKENEALKAEIADLKSVDADENRSETVNVEE